MLAALPAVAAASGGTIQGKVTRAGTGETPLKGVFVAVYLGDPSQQQSLAGFDQTDAAGEYAVDSLPDGKYEVEFVAHGYQPQYFDGAAMPNEADPVSIVAQATVPEVDAALVPEAQMMGTVTEAATGTPVWGVEVCVKEVDTGYPACALTDAFGKYAVRSLPAGTYAVRFDPSGSGRNLLAEYFDDAASEATATPVTVAAGGIGFADAALAAGPVEPDPEIVLPPSFAPPPLSLGTTRTTPAHRRLHCKKGFRKRRVKGKVRCVKVHRKRHHRHRAAR
jgi:hypothetical protein